MSDILGALCRQYAFRFDSRPRDWEERKRSALVLWRTNLSDTNVDPQFWPMRDFPAPALLERLRVSGLHAWAPTLVNLPGLPETFAEACLFHHAGNQPGWSRSAQIHERKD